MRPACQQYRQHRAHSNDEPNHHMKQRRLVCLDAVRVDLIELGQDRFQRSVGLFCTDNHAVACDVLRERDKRVAGFIGHDSHHGAAVAFSVALGSIVGVAIGEINTLVALGSTVAICVAVSVGIGAGVCVGSTVLVGVGAIVAFGASVGCGVGGGSMVSVAANVAVGNNSVATGITAKSSADVAMGVGVMVLMGNANGVEVAVSVAIGVPVLR